MSIFKTIAASLALSLALPAIASASTVTVRDNPNDNGGSVFAEGLGRGVDISYNGSNYRVGAGVFSLQYGSDSDGWVDFLSFCLQLNERLTLPKQHEAVSGNDYFLDTDDRNAVGALYNNYLTTDLGLADATSAAALQVILWEITEDGAANFNLSNGSFEVLTASVVNRANDLWGMIVYGLNDGIFGNLSVNVFTADGTQNLLFETPIPGAFFLLMSGVAGLGFASRKKKSA